jgi:hypothetical protein
MFEDIARFENYIKFTFNHNHITCHKYYMYQLKGKRIYHMTYEII